MKYKYYRIDPLTNRLFIVGTVYADDLNGIFDHIRKAYPNERILLDAESAINIKDPPKNPKKETVQLTGIIQ